MDDGTLAVTAEGKKTKTLMGVAPEARPADDEALDGISSPGYGNQSLVVPREARRSSRRFTSGEIDATLERHEADFEDVGSAPPSASSSGLSWKSLLGLDAAPGTEASKGRRHPLSETRPRTRESEPVQPWSASPRGRTARSSAGFYSSQAPEPEVFSVQIPKAPGLPNDLANRSPGTADERRRTRPSVSDARRETEEPRAGEPTVDDLRRPSAGPRARIFFPSHIRQQADAWLDSGSLSLPHSSSPRHARAVQRALLLALLAEPGYEALPLGLRQRIGWMFSSGWEQVATSAAMSEVNDLMTVLGVGSELKGRDAFLRAVRQLVPDPLPSMRPPSTFPPGRR